MNYKGVSTLFIVIYSNFTNQPISIIQHAIYQHYTTIERLNNTFYDY